MASGPAKPKPGDPAFYWFKSPVFSLALRPSGVPEAEVVIAAGGGGSSKTGIPNKLSVIGLDRIGPAGPAARRRRDVASIPQFATRSLHDCETGDRLVLQAAVSPDARHVAAVGGPHVLLYRLRKGTEPSLTQLCGFRAVPAPTAPLASGEDEPGLSAVAWTPDGAYIATGGDDGIVRLWAVGSLTDPAADGSQHASAAASSGTAAPASSKRRGPPIVV